MASIYAPLSNYLENFLTNNLEIYFLDANRRRFSFASGSSYAVNAAVDAIVYKTNNANTTYPRLFTAKLKSSDSKRLICQMVFEFAAIISEKYSIEDEDANFERRYVCFNTYSSIITLPSKFVLLSIIAEYKTFLIALHSLTYIYIVHLRASVSKFL